MMTKVKANFKKWQAVLIDLDGTLINSIPVLFRTYLNFMASLGQKGSQEEFAALNGKAFPEIFRFLKNKYGFNQNESELATHYHASFIDRYENESELFESAQETLQLINKKGKKALLVTSAPARLAHSMLHRLGIHSYFTEVITSEDVHASKPHPAIYIHAIKIAHVSNLEAVAIEDSYHGVSSAVGAGIPTIAYGATYHLGEQVTAKNWIEIQHLLRLQ